MKKIVFVSAILILSGCASTSQVQPYRPAGSTQRSWAITGKHVSGPTRNHVTIFFDGKTVAEGDVSLWDSSGNVYGEYEGHKVIANCERKYDAWGSSKYGCQVLVDGELAANLQF